MSLLPPLGFGLLLVAAALAAISIWAPRRLSVKLLAMACAAALLPLGYSAFVSLLSKPKPVEMAWFETRADEAVVLGNAMREGEGIYLYLMLPNQIEPRSYVLPWNRDMAQQLQDAAREAGEQGELRMRQPFEPSLDPDQPKFYALPQPKTMDKGGEQPAPAQRYRHPDHESRA